MAQFDVYTNENHQTAKKAPYLLDVQNDILSSLNTRVVIPLVVGVPKMEKLTCEFVIENETVQLQTSQMGAIFASELNTKVTSLKEKSEDIKNCIDFLVYGF